MPAYRLFELLAETRPDPAAFERRLELLDPEALLELAADVVDASAAVREPWRGPYEPRGDYCFSEDATEDLTDWIVAQGETFWRALVGAEDEALLRAAAERDREGPGTEARWRGRSPPVRGLIYDAYDSRRADEDYFAGLERVLSTRGRGPRS
ncbi:MAG: hypothetical protein R3B09_30105 [Nannocystaceae bacterium]